MTAIYPDWLTDSSIHYLYKGKTGRPTGEALLASLIASSFTVCTARVTKSRRTGSTELVKCTRRRQSFLLLLLVAVVVVVVVVVVVIVVVVVCGSISTVQIFENSVQKAQK